MIQRMVQLPKKNSFFLFGPRGTGKTTLLQQSFSKKTTLFIDLLDVRIFEELLSDPGRLQDMLHSSKNKNKRVVIDEIQKLPKLLDIVHAEIQRKKRQFILTGSSSRKLKQSGVNLLAGRAWEYNLHPLSCQELGKKFSLTKALQIGTLPEAFLAPVQKSAYEYLKAYTGTYLEKEIQQEQWVKKLQPFRKFLSIAAQMNGKILNKSKIARDIGVDDVTVANYFEILEDTLLGFTLPAYHQSIRKSQRQAPKFYFTDLGIARTLSKTLTIPLKPHTTAYGESFEHWFITEVIKLASYHRLDWNYFYLRTKHDLEIDLIIQKPKGLILIEIKSKNRVRLEDAAVLEKLGKEISPTAEKLLVSRDVLERDFGSVRALSWKKALHRLFN